MKVPELWIILSTLMPAQMPRFRGGLLTFDSSHSYKNIKHRSQRQLRKAKRRGR